MKNKFQISNFKFQILFAFCLFLGQAKANVVIGVAAVPEHYYDGVDTKKRADGFLCRLVVGHVFNLLFYDGRCQYPAESCL